MANHDLRVCCLTWLRIWVCFAKLLNWILINFRSSFTFAYLIVVYHFISIVNALNEQILLLAIDFLFIELCVNYRVALLWKGIYELEGILEGSILVTHEIIFIRYLSFFVDTITWILFHERDEFFPHSCRHFPLLIRELMVILCPKPGVVELVNIIHLHACLLESFNALWSRTIAMSDCSNDLVLHLCKQDIVQMTIDKSLLARLSIVTML